MANLITVKAFSTPVGNESPSLTHAIAVASIIDVTAYSDSNYPSVNSKIYAKYQEQNSIITGSWLVNESVSTIVTDSNA